MEYWDETGQGRHAFARKFWFRKFDLIWPSLTSYWPFLRSNLKMNATIVFCVPNEPYIMCYTTIMQHFHLVTLLDLTLPWPLLTMRPILSRYLLLPLKSLLTRFAFAAVTSRVVVADKTKSNIFGLWPDLELNCDLCKIFFLFIKTYSRAFDCRLAYLATAAGWRVSGGGGVKFTPASAAHSAGDPSAARVKPHSLF